MNIEHLFPTCSFTLSPHVKQPGEPVFKDYSQPYNSRVELTRILHAELARHPELVEQAFGEGKVLRIVLELEKNDSDPGLHLG